jgi:hypothetical protein
VIGDMESAPAQCDAVVFANVCHALGLDRLAEWLAAALERLRPGDESHCVIHEVEVLRQGEADFILWTPEDYATVFRDISAVSVEERPFARPHGVPLHTTILTRRGGSELPRDLAAILKAGFEALLPLKLKRLLAERDTLARTQDGASLSEGIRQRRRAFVSEQCTNILNILVDRGLLDRAVSTLTAATSTAAAPLTTQ